MNEDYDIVEGGDGIYLRMCGRQRKICGKFEVTGFFKSDATWFFDMEWIDPRGSTEVSRFQLDTLLFDEWGIRFLIQRGFLINPRMVPYFREYLLDTLQTIEVKCSEN